MSDNNFDSTVNDSKKKSRKNAAIAVICTLLVVAFGVCICASNLFFVKKISIRNVDGTSSSPYTEEQMLEGLELKKGEGLYSFDANEACNSAIYNLPYVKQIKLSRLWPSTIVAKVEFEKAAFYVSVSDELYIISDELKVLEKTAEAEKIELGSLILLKPGKIDHCIVGEQLGIDDDVTRITNEIAELLEENNILKNVKVLDLSDKFDISLMYDSRFEVILGDSKNLGTKIDFMKRIIEDRGENTPGGIIDVSDNESREAVYKKFV